MCSDRLDSDFPDIDLSQLDASDFDSVNCLSELHWCNDHATGASPASARYSTTDELFEVCRTRMHAHMYARTQNDMCRHARTHDPQCFQPTIGILEQSKGLLND